MTASNCAGSSARSRGNSCVPCDASPSTANGDSCARATSGSQSSGDPVSAVSLASTLSRYPPGGPGNRRSARAVVVDHLDVVAVRVEHVRAVVAGVVVRTFAGAAAVAVAGGGRRPVEGVDGGVVGGRERHVDVLRRPALPQRERAPRPDELDLVGSRPAELEPGVRREPLVEARDAATFATRNQTWSIPPPRIPP